MNEKSARMKKLKEAIRQASVYQEKLPVYREMGDKKYRFKKAMDKYKEAHEGDLKLFYRARRVLKEAGMPPEFSQETVDAWRKELVSLQAEYEAEYAELKPARAAQMKMSHIQYCVNRVIQKDERPQEKQKEKSVER